MLWGSSPRVWGQAVSTYTTEDDSRIIPTRVGTRNFEKFRICNSQDHPHACGDKGNKSKDYVIGVGSSPRVWGQASVSVACTGWSRIIPTRVGTSFTIMPTPEVYEDHPHACGDKTYKGENNTGTEGSSPRVWGQVFFGLCLLGLVGIIPTRVGTSGDMMVKAALH